MKNSSFGQVVDSLDIPYNFAVEILQKVAQGINSKSRSGWLYMKVIVPYFLMVETK